METKHSQPLIIAHRGAHHHGIVENTLEAFSEAFSYHHIDGVEGDFHLTKDNIIVCHHDDAIKNVSIKNHTFATLHSLQPNLPTLQEVFSIIPKDKVIYIEIKCGIEIFEFLAPILQDSHLSHNQIVIISFNAEVIHQAKVTYSAIKAYLLYELKETVIHTLSELKKLLAISQADGLSTNMTSHTDETFVKNVIDAGYSYHVWTAKSWKIDSIEKIEMLKVLGVASITLDAIDLL